MIRYLRLREKVQNYLRCLFSLIRKYSQRRRFWNSAVLHSDLTPSEKSIGYTVSDLSSSDVMDTDTIWDSCDMMKDIANQGAFDTSAITVYTDGACRGNPGQGGWAAIITATGKNYEISGGDEATTNNRMELTAAIEALKKIANTAEWRRIPITIYSDSQYLKDGITTWIHSWKKRGWITSDRTPVKNKELWVALDELNEQLNVRWNWVKGHAGNQYNERCDVLARNESRKF